MGTGTSVRTCGEYEYKHRHAALSVEVEIAVVRSRSRVHLPIAVSVGRSGTYEYVPIAYQPLDAAEGEESFHCHPSF